MNRNETGDGDDDGDDGDDGLSTTVLKKENGGDEKLSQKKVWWLK